MYIKSFGINIDKSKRLWAIIFAALLVAAILISISFILVFKTSNKASVNKITDLFEAKSYYAEYDVKVFSNKNQNDYKIKEWYVKDEEEYKFRIETNNSENNFVYCGNPNSIYIKSDEQLNSLNLQEYNSKRNNLFSISSFMEFLYELNLLIENDSYIGENCCKLKEVEIDKELKYIVSISEACANCDKCKICNKFTKIGMKISKFELVLDKEKIKPKQYIVYDTNGKIYIDIIYNKFLVNEEFDEKLFAF